MATKPQSLGQQDGSVGKELTAKSEGLSSTLGTHIVEKINFFILITYYFDMFNRNFKLSMFLKIHFYFYSHVCTYVWVFGEARRGRQILWCWSYRQF